MREMGPVFLSLLLGVAGGAVFYVASLPLPWVLGAMTANTIAAVFGVKVGLSIRLREIMVCALGMLLGSSFTPEIAEQILSWGGAVLVMIVFVAVTVALITTYYIKIGGFDRITSFFSATPGGLAPMTIIGESYGGDGRIIALAHAVRIIIVVSFIPFYLTFVEGLDLPVRDAIAGSGKPMAGLGDLSILVALSALGYGLAKLARIPAPSVIGPMLICAAAYLAGIVEGEPPPPLVIAAQVTIGASVGARFVGLNFRSVAKPVLMAAISALIMLSGAAVASALVAPLLGLSRPAVLLALSPGGLAEMSLIGFSLNIDTAFVATLHVARIICVVLLAPLVFRLLGWGNGPPKS